MPAGFRNSPIHGETPTSHRQASEANSSYKWGEETQAHDEKDNPRPHARPANNKQTAQLWLLARA